MKAPAVWNITLGGLRGAFKALSHCPRLQGAHGAEPGPKKCQVKAKYSATVSSPNVVLILFQPSHRCPLRGSHSLVPERKGYARTFHKRSTRISRRILLNTCLENVSLKANLYHRQERKQGLGHRRSGIHRFSFGTVRLLPGSAGSEPKNFVPCAVPFASVVR